jgi:hypothetical protein
LYLPEVRPITDGKMALCYIPLSVEDFSRRFGEHHS